MCGIYGSNSRDRFYDLYLLNRSRGTYGSGHYCFNDNTSYAIYSNKELSLNDIPKDMKYYLGHNRAPTSESKAYSEQTSHPFFTDNFVFSHNGIIKQVKLFEDQFNKIHQVDSMWIGDLLERYSLKNTLEKISNNPFAVWIKARNIYDCIYLARVANPIYYSKTYNSFSSTAFENSTLLDEGKVYRCDTENLQWTLETFTFKSLYFIPG